MYKFMGIYSRAKVYYKDTIADRHLFILIQPRKFPSFINKDRKEVSYFLYIKGTYTPGYSNYTS